MPKTNQAKLTKKTPPNKSTKKPVKTTTNKSTPKREEKKIKKVEKNVEKVQDEEQVKDVIMNDDIDVENAIVGFDKELGVPTHSLVDAGQVYRAVESLLAFHAEDGEGKKQLFEDAGYVQLIITLKQLSTKTRRAPYVIGLTHPIMNENAEICIFVKDPSKANKEMIKELMIPNVKKIIAIGTLREKYGRYEARRRLLASYDLFLCDDSLQLVLPRLLGKVFFQAKKFPIPVKVNSNLAAGIQKALNCTQLHISQGPVCNIRIGSTAMTTKEITENLITSIDKIAAKIPQRKWKNIKSLALKLPNSPALPVYYSPVPQIITT